MNNHLHTIFSPIINSLMSAKSPHLSDWIKQEWTVGQYEPTESFKSIKNHSCVCRKGDMGLIAVTGPAEDVESQKQADLFAAAPKLLEACGEALGVLNEPGIMDVDEWKEWRKRTIKSLIKAIAKAEGKQ